MFFFYASLIRNVKATAGTGWYLFVFSEEDAFAVCLYILGIKGYRAEFCQRIRPKVILNIGMFYTAK